MYNRWESIKYNFTVNMEAGCFRWKTKLKTSPLIVLQLELCHIIQHKSKCTGFVNQKESPVSVCFYRYLSIIYGNKFRPNLHGRSWFCNFWIFWLKWCYHNQNHLAVMGSLHISNISVKYLSSSLQNIIHHSWLKGAGFKPVWQARYDHLYAKEKVQTIRILMNTAFQ